ncbi:MAG TPA: DUF5666 domain-containing protein [Thermoanaerobaculia bacterium]|jgi:hypothetical protein|nr:DUF5666 domain-containing protein [Thermoanaerobaculia bacterium]
MARKTLSRLALASALILPLGTLACSEGQSPTEPAFDLEAQAAPSSTLSSATGDSRRGGRTTTADDNNNNRRGRGGRRNDDVGGDDDNQRQGGRNQRPRNPAAQGQEAEGTVARVDGGTLVLTSGQAIAVNAQTRWDARGDLLSLGEVANAVQAGQNPRAEARGTRQANGTILAQVIKAEVDR